MKNEHIIIVIPSYEPDTRLLELLDSFCAASLKNVIVVNDGSSEAYDNIFAEAESKLHFLNGVLLRHDINRGKGAAIKTAIKYIIENETDVKGIITADSDGQHDVDSIRAVMEALSESQDALILGVRDFNIDGIPWKSYAGNTITLAVMKYLCGVKVSDTQTGLRGIPASFFSELLSIKSDRFEFETEMLLRTKDKVEIVEVPINTIYDSKENHSTHFDPWKDSFRIYKILFASFIKYTFSSLSSCVIDLVLFSVFCHFLKPAYPMSYAFASTVIARVISATYNFTLNYKLVFQSKQKVGSSAIRYIALAICQMTLSAALVTFGIWIFKMLPEVVIKIVIDSLLFIASYYIQRKFVF